MRQLRGHYLPHLSGIDRFPPPLDTPQAEAAGELLAHMRIWARHIELTYPALTSEEQATLRIAAEYQREGSRVPPKDCDVHERRLCERGLLDPATGWPTFALPDDAHELLDGPTYLERRRAMLRERFRRSRSR